MTKKQKVQTSLAKAQALCQEVYERKEMQCFPLVWKMPKERLKSEEEAHGFSISALYLFTPLENGFHHIEFPEHYLLNPDDQYLLDSVLHELAHAIRQEQLSPEERELSPFRSFEEHHDPAWEAILADLLLDDWEAYGEIP